VDSTTKTIADFIELLASKAPVPGGGGASALVGAIGMALGNMVGALTLGKKKYAGVEADILNAQERTAKLRKELLLLIDKDAESFEPLSKVYALPSGSDEEKARKVQLMEKCLCDACLVPLEIMKKCGEGIKLCEEFAAKGSKYALSDAGAAVIFCKAALTSASLNIYINTKAMQDGLYAKKLNNESDALLAEYEDRANKLLKRVKEQLSEKKEWDS
jgi:formiminotetrahydrofolate cyclodeaminase